MLYPNVKYVFSLVCAVVALAGNSSPAGDWPMWRYNSYRSADSPDELPDRLQLLWIRQYTQRRQVWDDPLNHDLMPYDKVFEPVILQHRMFLGFNDRDKMIALDMSSGEQLWEFYTGGPVRLPPVAWRDKVYFASDDGYLYCVSADAGRLIWKFRGGPSERKVIGNKRLISAWPARGGPVIRDGHVYFAASIWPLMGTFIYSLDAETGDVAWVNDSTSAQYIKQPHSAHSFAGVAPQGALVATQNVLLVPGGRSVPAALERTTGRFMHFQIGGKGTGGSFVCANESNFFVHTRMRGVRTCDLESGDSSEQTLREPVLTDSGTISFEDGAVRAATKSISFTTKADASGDLIKAGKRIYAAGEQTITSLDESGSIVETISVNGPVLRLLAGDGKLVAVTLDGRILVYGESAGSEAPIRESPSTFQPLPGAIEHVKEIIRLANAAEGYALWYGMHDTDMLQAVLEQSALHVTVVDPDAERVNDWRRQYDSAGLYGHRVTFQQGDPIGYQAPPYVANLIVVERPRTPRYEDPKQLAVLYESVRPYGGALWIRGDGDDQDNLAEKIARANLAKAKIVRSSDGIVVLREGSLPGSADWTHRYGDIANTVKSNDRRVKLPLGILWFGGSSNMDVLPRHGHAPPEQVIAGRTFVEGMDSISARDTYTGRVLWKRTFEDLGNFGVYFDGSYHNSPLSTKYNQVHIPGANGRGTNYIATENEVYVVVGSRCEVLDAQTGETIRYIKTPRSAPDQKPPLWGFIGMYGDILLSGDGFANYSGAKRDQSSRQGLEILDMSASDGLIAFDRHTGDVLWKLKANHSFIHNGIVAGGGRVYCLDKLPFSVEEKLRRRGLLEENTYRVIAVDAKTGAPQWEKTDKVFGTWMSYSEKHDILLQAGARASDRLPDEVGGGIAAYRGKDGSTVWEDLERRYSGPCILHNDMVLTNAVSYQKSSGAFSLFDGSPHVITNPITGKSEPWQFIRTYGCNTAIASEHLLTFRSGAAGFYDLEGGSGTGNFGGFRSGCTSNLVIAGGVVNAPDYTRTCSCSYQNQTSLALVHMPDIEIWTNSTYQADPGIKRIGINLGAPGDRTSSEGTLWIDYPCVGGEAHGVDVTVEGTDTQYFRRHASAILDGTLPWVAASGVQDLTGVSIGVPSNESSVSSWTVRLYFSEPHEIKPGQRVFDVFLQGNAVLNDFDVVKTAGGPLRSIVVEFSNVSAEDMLTIGLTAAADTQLGPVLSGLEVIAAE